MTQMKRGKGKRLPLYCFSPPVMLATFFIEISFLLYVVIRYKMNPLSRLIALLLLLLATFQLAEYNVCGGFGANAQTWSRIGFVAITLLPPIGIHLIYTLAKRPWSNVTGAAYGMAAAWIAIFTFGEKVFNDHVCAGNYIIFHIKPGLGSLYFFHYYLWLFIGAYLCYLFAKSMNKKNRESLLLLALGYGSLLIPTTTVNMFNKNFEGLPSIMCGFAIILAVIVTFGILPRSGILKNSKIPKSKR